MMMSENCYLRLGGVHLVFRTNLAVTGGALALFGSYVNSLWPTFINNSALLDFSQMTDIQLNWARQLGCGVGNGGAVCLSGYPTELTTDFLATVFTNNKAVNGGAIYNAATGSCGPSCFRMVVANCTLVENVAVGGGGGGIFWLHEESTRYICQENTTLELLTAIYTNQMYTRGAIADKFGSALPCVEWTVSANPWLYLTLPSQLNANKQSPHLRAIVR
jgi:predicted outer membrane repeat protein